MSNIINISLAFDDKYTRYAYITLMSALINNHDSEIHAYILQYDLSETSKSYLNELFDKYNGKAVFLDINPNIFDNLPTIKKWPIQVYFRLLLPELLPQDVDRIIYFDSDMTINASLKDLYDLSFDGNDLIGCYDLNLLAADLDTFLYYRNKALAPLYEQNTYINSGMLLMNISQIRKLYSVMSYVNAAKELNFNIYAPDQDLINYVHMGKIKRVDPRKYNYPAYIAFLEGVRSDNDSSVPVMHFVCEKPWQGGNHAHFETELIWWKYAFQSTFREEFMEQYIRDSIVDPTIMQNLNGTDEIKNNLVKENARLKKELGEAMDQVKRVINMLSK